MDLDRLWNRLNPFVAPTGFAGLIDIFIVSILFFWLLGIVRGTRAAQLLRGIGILLVVAFALSSLFPQLITLSWVLRNAVQPALLVAIPLLFQPELRRALERLGSTELINRRFGGSRADAVVETINIVARAASQLSQQGVGALIVIERDTPLSDYAERGVMLDARLAVPLLLNIFFPNAPLHDMAVILRGNRILAANVVLPLSEDLTGPRRYGTRHRAAKGITEQADAIAVVVSEETGAISIAQDGRLVSYLNEARLRSMLATLLKVQLEEARA